MIETLSRGGEVQTCDAQSAYCQAPLKGAPKWLAIPPVLRDILNIPSDMRTPVCRMHKALCGLVRSGFDWAEHCASNLVANGWKRCWEGERNVFSKYFNDEKGRKRRVLLVVYVDDFICGGKRSCIEQVWAEVSTLFAMDPPERLPRFLGVYHNVRDAGASKRGNKRHELVMSQLEY